MTRDQIDSYERECVNRAGVFLNRRNSGDGTVQRLIRNLERRKSASKSKQAAGE
ncbi:hypothetical protein [Atlantibacter hermannii]|uniref:hypothetical protein n=1 Tax=Atlantibacter hermannii TaxID=565 RepID=UPI0028AED565|nr:hypothetical protein [Atlantibacter hermannii]